MKYVPCGQHQQGEIPEGYLFRTPTPGEKIQHNRVRQNMTGFSVLDGYLMEAYSEHRCRERKVNKIEIFLNIVKNMAVFRYLTGT